MPQIADVLTGTDDIFDSIFRFEDFSTVFSAGYPEKVGPARTTVQAYKARTEVLRVAATQDGGHLNSVSRNDFFRFIESEPRMRRGNLVLMDNGNLRAVWKDGQGTHLGLQFLGGGVAQFVIFKQRKTTGPISRVTGRDTFGGLKLQIDAFELHPLLYG